MTATTLLRPKRPKDNRAMGDTVASIKRHKLNNMDHAVGQGGIKKDKRRWPRNPERGRARQSVQRGRLTCYLAAPPLMIQVPNAAPHKSDRALAPWRETRWARTAKTRSTRPGGNDVPPAHGMRHRTALTLPLGGGRCPHSVLGTPWACQRPGIKPVKNFPGGGPGVGPPVTATC